MNTGIIEDLDINEYHENKVILSTTGLKHAKKSSRAFAEYLINPPEEKPKTYFDFGNAFEVLLIDRAIGTNDGERKVAVRPVAKWQKLFEQKRPKIKKPAATAAYKRMVALWEHVNRSAYYKIDDVGKDSFEMAQKMMESTLKSDLITNILKSGQYQKTFSWIDSETNLQVKCRPDIITKSEAGSIIVDIKTCNDSSPAEWKRQVANFDYPLQAIMQIEGAVQTGFVDRVDDYYWLAVEKNAPYNAQLYRFKVEDWEWNRDSMVYYLKRAANVLKTISDKGKSFSMFDVPGYEENADNLHGVIDVDIPLWYRDSNW